MSEEDPKTDPPTPPTPPDPQPDPPPAPPHSECHTLINGLMERIETVENHLQTVIDVKPDSSPVKGPWTHRKFGNK